MNKENNLIENVYESIKILSDLFLDFLFTKL